MTTPHHPLAGERLISRTELRHFVNASDMALWRWVRAGKFPAPVYIGARRYWLATSIERWLAERRPVRDSVEHRTALLKDEALL